MLTSKDRAVILEKTEANINSIEGFEAVAICAQVGWCLVVRHGGNRVYLVLNDELELTRISFAGKVIRSDAEDVDYKLAYRIDSMIQANKFLYLAFRKEGR